MKQLHVSVPRHARLCRTRWTQAAWSRSSKRIDACDRGVGPAVEECFFRVDNLLGLGVLGTLRRF